MICQLYQAHSGGRWLNNAPYLPHSCGEASDTSEACVLVSGPPSPRTRPVESALRDKAGVLLTDPGVCAQACVRAGVSSAAVHCHPRAPVASGVLPACKTWQSFMHSAAYVAQRLRRTAAHMHGLLQHEKDGIVACCALRLALSKTTSPILNSTFRR